MIDKNMLTVGEAAKKMNVTVRTLQYYDKKDLLKPSERSDGGRRLYSQKDLVKLHQIISLKHLGFSLNEIKNRLMILDTPNEVVEILEKQKNNIELQLKTLEATLRSIDLLQKEIIQMKSVDFAKYADIITMLNNQNEYNWVWKFFDEELSTHVIKKFTKHPQKALNIIDMYQEALDEILELMGKEVLPTSDSAIAVAEKWWKMVKEFTGNDMSLVPKLIKFNENKSGWNNDFMLKQQQADDYLKEIIEAYFSREKIVITEMEEEY